MVDPALDQSECHPLCHFKGKTEANLVKDGFSVEMPVNQCIAFLTLRVSAEVAAQQYGCALCRCRLLVHQPSSLAMLINWRATSPIFNPWSIASLRSAW